MWLYYGAILIVVLSNVLYHLSQKSTPADMNPVSSLIVTYLVALLFCLALLPFFPEREGIFAGFRKMNWSSITLGLAVVGLEMGFLLAYRAGWNIGIAQFWATVLLTLLLIPIGLLFFHERLSWVNIIGIFLCFGGFLLLNHH